MNIEYYKWSKKNSKILYKSLKDILGIQEPQLYFPIMSLFFYIHNTPYSHKTIDFKRDYYLTKIINKYEHKSNLLINGEVTHKNNKQHKQLFGKIIPLIDPIHYL